MLLAATVLCSALLALLAPGQGRAQDLSAFESPRALASNASTDDNEDRKPRVATDGLGNWVAVWQSKDLLDGSIGNDADILFARSSDGGDTWTDPRPLNGNASSDSRGDFLPQVAADGMGNWVAVWESRDSLDGTLGDDRDILFARSVDQGASWSAPAPLHTNASGDQGQDRNAQVVTDRLGNWLVAWVSTNSFGDTLATDEDIVYARSTNAGASWSAPAPLNSNADRNTRSDDEPRLSINGRGTWVAVWQSKEGTGGLDNDFDILFARSENAGASWSESHPINSNADNDGGADWTPAIAGDDAGLWIAVWVRRSTPDFPDTADTDIWFSRSEDDGRTWSSRKRLHRNTQRDDWQPDITTDRQGTWAVVWYGKRKNDDEIVMVRSATDGSSWTSTDFLNANATKDKGDDRFPNLVTDGKGDWLAVWESNDKLDKTLGRDWDILFARNLLSQGDDQQKCTNDQNKAAAKLTKAQEKQVLRCLEAPPFDACLAENRPSSKPVRSCGMLDEGGFSTTPDFGVAPPAVVADAALAAPVALAEDLFGVEIDGARPASDPNGEACQERTLQESYRVHDAFWKETLTGKKSVLAGRGPDGGASDPPESAADLGSDLATWLATDPKGKLEKAIDSLADAVVKTCENPSKLPLTSLDALFPGSCTSAAAGGAAALADCASERTRCRFCQQLNQSDELDIDCDTFADASCSALR